MVSHDIERHTNQRLSIQLKINSLIGVPIVLVGLNADDRNDESLKEQLQRTGNDVVYEQVRNR